MPTYRVAVIGLGGIANAHMMGWNALPNATVVAGADVVQGQLDKFAGKYPAVKNLYLDYHRMLAAEKPELVSVCTWPPLHADMVVAAAEAGAKGIACEKPMATSIAECDRMIAACKANGAKLVVGHQRRYNLRYSEAKAALKSGAIGSLVEVQTLCRGDLFTDATHSLDLMRFFVDDNPVDWLIGQVECKTGRSRFGHEVEDAALAFVQFKNGVRGIIQTGDVSPQPAYQRLTLTGTDGRIEIGGDSEEYWRIINGAQAGWVTHQVAQEAALNPFACYMRDLIRWIEEGGEHLLAGEGGRATIEIIAAVFESSHRRSRMRLPIFVYDNPLARMLANNEL
jgi:UDP-N-acetylglucosamine 3-dehydrogenase